MENMHGAGFRGLRATKRSRIRVIGSVLAVWSVSAAITIAFYGVLVYYDKVDVMSKTEKRKFNSIVTGLSIALGLAIALGLEQMFSELQWWILTRRYRSRRKVEVILRSEDTRHIVMLGIRSRRPTTKIAALAVVALTLGSQVAVAMIGLCYSTDTAEKTPLLIDHGKVAVANMSAITTVRVVNSNSTSLLAQQYTANNYGTWSLAYPASSLEELPKKNSIWDPKQPWYFCSDATCRYIFHEAAASLVIEDDENTVFVHTDRYIDSSAVCKSWNVTSGGDGRSNNITISNETGSTSVYIPILEGTDQTTYMTNTSEGCGDGCSVVTAFEASKTYPWYYSCNISVSAAVGGTLPQHEAGIDLRTLAAGSIALKGYDMPSFIEDQAFQYQVYPAESVYGFVSNGSTESMAGTMARFAIGVVGIAAVNNEILEVDGLVPHKGTLVNISHWEYLHLIFLITTLTQLVLGLAAGLLSNSVVIPRRGALDIARVMRPMLERNSGTDRWIYRNRLMSSDGVYDVYMEEEQAHDGHGSEQIEMDRKEPPTIIHNG